MELLGRYADVLGCYNLTHYSFCRYCSYPHKCEQFRKKYFRNCLVRTSDIWGKNRHYGPHVLYNNSISYDLTGKVIMPLIHNGKIEDFMDDVEVLKQIEKEKKLGK